jgi:hypothetical protein
VSGDRQAAKVPDHSFPERLMVIERNYVLLGSIGSDDVPLESDTVGAAEVSPDESSYPIFGRALIARVNSSTAKAGGAP